MSQSYEITHLWEEVYKNRRKTKQFLMRSEPVGDEYRMNAKRWMNSPARREMIDNRNAWEWRIYCTIKQRSAQRPHHAYYLIFWTISRGIICFDQKMGYLETEKHKIVERPWPSIFSVH